MRWLASLSLKGAIVLGMALGILLPVLAVGPVLALDSYQREIDARITTLLKQYGTMLAQSMSTPIWHVDLPTAESFVNSLMSNPDVIRVRVEDAALGPFIVVEKPVPAGGKLVQEVRPVVRDGATIGRVTIDMTTHYVQEQFLGKLVTAAVALLMQVLISFGLLFLLFEHRLMRPLRQLLGDAKRLSSGELTQPVSVLRRDEIGALAEGLDTMRENLNEQISHVRDLNATLEQRVSDRTQSLNAANQELVSAMAALKTAHDEIQRSERLAALGALVAGVAHELNTPIGNCVTVASTLQDISKQFAQTSTTGLTRSALASFVENTEHASELLTRNLNVAVDLIRSFKQVAVDRTRAQRREFQLDAMVAETLLILSPGFKRSYHQIQVDVPTGITMTSYPGQLGQILTNLINNAVLHGFGEDKPGVIRISARLLTAESVEMVVTDDGVGVPEVNLRRIFDPFFTTRLGQGGSGLGLNIVYNLMKDVMGGTVQVQSTLGSGTRFILVMPRVASDHQDPDDA
ncbi:MAG: ATP-binding protein [Pseudomonadota bacterium]